MAAAYDSFDYPAYWIGREYEHKSEVIAIKAFLHKIQKINKLLEVGAGFGRLTPLYFFRAKKVILSDPSSKLLHLARDVFNGKPNIKFMHSSLENLPNRIRPKSLDLIIMVRVLHHIKDPEEAFKIHKSLLTDDGYLILEYANKQHLKATITEFLKGNLTFPIDISTKDMRTKRSIKKGYLPFFNFAPGKIEEILERNGFQIIEKRSVSNIRHNIFKRILSTEALLYLEKHTQRFFANFNAGPSIFLLLKKRG